jgi:hypothetical protein
LEQAFSCLLGNCIFLHWFARQNRHTIVCFEALRSVFTPAQAVSTHIHMSQMKEMKMKKSLQQQIKHAFNSAPALDGIIHGQRKIKQGKHGSRASLFFSAKNQALIPVESRYELTYCYQLESDPRVSKYRTQALAIPYRNHALYPDFLVCGVDNIVFVREVKASVFVDTERNGAKLNYLGEVLGREGIEFGVVTEFDFWKGQEKANRIMLYDRGGRNGFSSALIDWLVELVVGLEKRERIFFRVRQEIASRGLSCQLLEAAIFQGRLSCDLTRPITADSSIEVQP